MAAATISQQSGGVPLAAGVRLSCFKVTAPAESGATSFTVPIVGLTSSDMLAGVVAGNAGAADILPSLHVALSTDTVTFTFVAQDLAGTEVFHFSVISNN